MSAENNDKINEYGALMEGYRDKKTEVLGEKTFVPRIPHVLAWN